MLSLEQMLSFKILLGICLFSLLCLCVLNALYQNLNSRFLLVYLEVVRKTSDIFPTVIRKYSGSHQGVLDKLVSRCRYVIQISPFRRLVEGVMKSHRLFNSLPSKVFPDESTYICLPVLFHFIPAVVTATSPVLRPTAFPAPLVILSKMVCAMSAAVMLSLLPAPRPA